MNYAGLISTDRQAREAEEAIKQLDRALTSEEVLKSLVAGFPQVVIEGIRRSLLTERRQKLELVAAYKQAKDGDFTLLKEQAGSDPGAFLIVARIIRGLSQKELARKLGLREQAIQRWEAERYRSISLANFLKVAQVLGVQWAMTASEVTAGKWLPTYDVKRDDLLKVLKHARTNGWLATHEETDENSIATLVRYVGDHVNRYGTPSLLRTGLNVSDSAHDWSLLSWKAQVTRRAEAIITKCKPQYSPINVSWILDLVKISRLEDGPTKAREMLLKNGVVLVAEPQIPGMKVDGAAFLMGDVPVVGLTLLRDALDNFWFTLLHEIGHVVLHYHTGLASGFFDSEDAPMVDEFEREANQFAANLLIPEEIWRKSPARIAKTAGSVEKLANQLGVNAAIIFGRIRMERNDYSIFSDKIGRGRVRSQLLSK